MNEQDLSGEGRMERGGRGKRGEERRGEETARILYPFSSSGEGNLRTSAGFKFVSGRANIGPRMSFM